jgi:hypothetical protein
MLSYSTHVRARIRHVVASVLGIHDGHKAQKPYDKQQRMPWFGLVDLHNFKKLTSRGGFIDDNIAVSMIIQIRGVNMLIFWGLRILPFSVPAGQASGERGSIWSL